MSLQSPTRPTGTTGGRFAEALAVANHGLWPAVILALLTAAVATMALVSHQLADTRAYKAVPAEGFYWAVAQYQIAHQRLKQELRAISAGEPADAEELTRRSLMLASKASILTAPSEIKTLLEGVPGFAEGAHQLAELQTRIAPALEKKGFAQTDALKVLGEFKVMGDDELLNRLASNVRLAEVSAKDELLHRLTRRYTWVWAGVGLCWTALVLWMFYVVRSRRRYQIIATDRQHAVEAMEQAISVKRKFLSMVSHELRSPLQSITTSAESLALDLDVNGSRPQSVAAVRRIRHAVSVLQGQFRDLLTIARSDAGQLGVQVESFELGELARDVCAGLEDSALAKGVDLVVEVPESPVTVSADPIRIAQVLRNLVENAVRYTSAGQVQVRVGPFLSTLSSATDLRNVHTPEMPGAAGWVRFVVHDTGPGLPSKVLDRLKNAATPFEWSGDGTGIGLFVIRDVLLQLGGRIDVHSRGAPGPAGEGTTFTVTIPAVEVRSVAGSVNDSGTAVSLNVLIVDDLSDVLEALSDEARRLGHSCSTAKSADEAHLMLAKTRFDAILIDLQMPNKDGLTLATEIRSNHGPNATSMLILISAAENGVTGQTWPFDGFLQKPIDGTALARLIGSRT